MKANVIIQARIGSTRLPNKIFKNLEGKPILWHVTNRLSYSKLLDKTIIATTTLPEDDKVEQFCVENNILSYRGSSDNVLSRYYEAAKIYESNIVIRITSDCPVIDPVILDAMIEKFLEISKNEKLDYMSNSIERTFPRGLDIEIFTFAALEKTHHEAIQKYELEHVTPYIYQHPKLFNLKNYKNAKDLSFHRWCVDTTEDLKLIEEIYKELYNHEKIFLTKDILKLFENNPELININRSVIQKRLGE